MRENAYYLLSTYKCLLMDLILGFARVLWTITLIQLDQQRQSLVLFVSLVGTVDFSWLKF